MSPQPARVLPSILYGTGVFVAALLAGGFFGLFVFSFGLFMPIVVARPLAFVVTSHFAALSGSWAANLLAPDRSRTRLLTAIGLSLVAALLVVALDLALRLTIASDGPVAERLLPIWLGLSLASSVAVWTQRTVRSSLPRDALLTLGFSAAAILVVVGGVTVTCMLSPCVA